MSTQRVPLSQLLPPTSNPRKRIDPAGIEGLARSIQTDGVLQNLVVKCLKGDRFRVVTGERRYRALKLLESRGEIDGDYRVPVEVRHGLKPADAQRIALVENVQREALDAIDEADGFAALLQKGATLDDVAAQTGLSTTTVKRRLALAGLCAEAKQAVRDGSIGLGIAEALTLGTHEQQARILADSADGIWFDADDVRARLIEEKPSVAMAVFPLERYSGTFTSDLFAEAEATYFDNAPQFHDLQRRAVEELAAERSKTAAFVDLFDTQGAPWWHYRAAQDGESGGVVINLTPAGRVEVRDGLVRHEVQRAVAAETRESPLAVRRERPEYPSWLVRHMAAHKTLAVQTLLIAARRTAREVAVVVLMRGADGHHGRVSVEAHPALALFSGEDGRPRSHDAVEAAAAHFERMLGLAPAEDDEPAYGPRSRGAWERLVGEPKDGADLYERVKRLSDEDLDGLHLLLTILAFGQRHPAEGRDEGAGQSPPHAPVRDDGAPAMRLPVSLLALPLLAACATESPSASTHGPATPQRPYTLADLHIPPTAMEREPKEKAGPRPSRAQTRSWVGQANEAALDLPTLTCFKGKSCEYWYQPDLQYLVYMAEGNQTLVCLKPGEVVRDIVAPGAQVWIPHQPYSFGKGARRTECIAFMPRRAGLNQQISLFTSERKYDLNVETHRRTHHVEVRWRYPEDYLATLNGQATVLSAAAGDRRDRTTELAYRDRRCTYTLDGDTPEWRPVPTPDGQPPVCDDGEVTVINFTPGALGGYGAPILWRIGPDNTRIPVQYGRMNATYRVAGIHDHLLLAIGAQEVHIRRTRP